LKRGLIPIAQQTILSPENLFFIDGFYDTRQYRIFILKRVLTVAQTATFSINTITADLRPN
jgi:hypothetical protein